MPEYIAPGVFIEEVDFRAKPIEGVPTSTTGFVGAARFGPVDVQPSVVNSLAEYERVYGDGGQLAFEGAKSHNFQWHAARAFFEEGGKRLYVARIFRGYAPAGAEAGKIPPYTRPGDTISKDKIRLNKNKLYTDGHARAWCPKSAEAAASEHALLVRARFPGAAGNVRVTLTFKLGQNILGDSQTDPVTVTAASSLREFDTVWIGNAARRTDAATRGVFHIARFEEGRQTWRFTRRARNYDQAANSDLRLGDVDESKRKTLSAARGDQVRVLTLTVAVMSAEGETTFVRENVALDPNHVDASGAPDSLAALFKQATSSTSQARTPPVVILSGEKIDTGLKLLNAIADSGLNTGLLSSLDDLVCGVAERAARSTDVARSVTFTLEGGGDGSRPTAAEYVGGVNYETNAKSGLKAFEDLEEISIVAAPGSTAGYKRKKIFAEESDATTHALIAHAERTRYRIAVLDSGEGQTEIEVRYMRAKFDSSRAALYYPWVRALDPVTKKEIDLPPSGFVAGLFARNDAERGVHKAPANLPVRLATGSERAIDKAQQDALNPEGINCFRSFEGRGMRLWGARTISSDPEWKYVSLRRYFAYLEQSIDKGTRWVVFEPNGERLWNDVRSMITNFLVNEWRSGALLGTKPEEAFYVRCDRTTMTQDDLDNGRLVCVIGIASLKPAEFVIVRIGRWTSDRKA